MILTISEQAVNLALADAALDYQILEDDYVHALTEAVTYRDLFLLSLHALHDEQKHRKASEQRLRQAMGVEAWRLDEADA